ncbi:MAG: cadherin-like beta sandwich domain-containing protein, partial [Spirochaetaceae bacterium]|nr:cadherin-like beta sandwich domain-containing protein [Spirochaetaceae bacterium]
EFTQSPDETTADLSALYASAGAVSPDFTKDKTDYTITVPFGTAEFSISAQAENPYLEPVLLPAGGSGGSLLDADLMSAENGGPLPEGSSRYEITVSAGDKSAEKTYSINVICLPDLSLKTFQVTKDDFVRDLAPLDTQSVYLPYSGGVTVVAEAGNDGALVSYSPSPTISKIIATAPATVTVTVSKSVNGEAYSKDYVLNLYYGAGMNSDPLASGGYVSFIPSDDKDANYYYEVHTFPNAGTYMLLFDPIPVGPVVADYLIVAGGGGAGGGLWWGGGGGGGAGGLLYQPEQTLTLTDGSVPVAVGKGGNGGSGNNTGSDGEPSSIGDVTVSGGGGGGAGHDSNSNPPGNSGGSGGGGGVGYNYHSGKAGSSTASGGVMGNPGGDGSMHMAGGGGGGGAGSAGKSKDNGGAGGDPWSPDNGPAWIKDVTGADQFSRGGNGGHNSGVGTGAAGLNYGDGGAGGGLYRSPGGAGHSGIVIVRFQRESAAAPAEP